MNKKNKITNKGDTSRRTLLKSIAIGSGAVATTAALPQKWTKPVLDQVLLPAHAQTSAPMVGTFATVAPSSLFFKGNDKSFASTQYALLDLLISKAEAYHNATQDFCGFPVSDSGDGSITGNSNIFVRINGDLSVDVAIDGLDTDVPSSVCGETSNLVGNDIADVDVQLNGSYYVTLTNMVASGNQVTGNYHTSIDLHDGGGIVPSTDDNNGDDEYDGGGVPGNCSGTFTAPLGGVFPMSNFCGGDE